jgi:hypothetical protein
VAPAGGGEGDEEEYAEGVGVVGREDVGTEEGSKIDEVEDGVMLELAASPPPLSPAAPTLGVLVIPAIGSTRRSFLLILVVGKAKGVRGSFSRTFCHAPMRVSRWVRF